MGILEVGFLDLIILAIIVLGATFGYTQVIVPIKNGTPLFPMLMSNHKKLEADLAKAKDEVEISNLAREIRETRKKAKQQ